MKVFSPSPPMADAARDFKGPAEMVFTRIPNLKDEWEVRQSGSVEIMLANAPVHKPRDFLPALEQSGSSKKSIRHEMQ